MSNEQIKNKIEEVKGTEKGNELLEYMLEKGYALEEWKVIETANEDVLEALSQFFKDEVALDGLTDGSSALSTKLSNDNADDTDNTKEGEDSTKENKDLTMDEIKNIKKKSRKSDKSSAKEKSNDKEKIDDKEKESQKKDDSKNDKVEKKSEESKSVILKKYKMIDNLITLTTAKETILSNVNKLTKDGDMYGTYLNGIEIAKLFLDGNLVYDPTMQRGVKEDKDGNLRAVFREGHIKEMSDSMKDNNFTPTQIHFALITDDEELEYDYDEETHELTVHGKIRLLDGQHRTKALVKVFNEIATKKIQDIGLDKYVFNVAIHAVPAERARTIYANIDKNLKLDKSQARQLQTDSYANIINYLNQNGDSDLKGKIAVARPVGKRLVLFSTMAQALEESIQINGVHHREEVKQYIKNFFNYVTFKFDKAFGANEEARAEFKKNNLLNENNFFNTWIHIAFADMTNYKINIDKMAENVDFFKKDNPIWLKVSAVKHKVKGEGFAMNNTNTGLIAMTNKTLELLGYEKERAVVGGE